MTEELKKGDVVQLKSGGPKMTVEDPNTHEGRVGCAWFVEGEVKSEYGTFVREALNKIQGG